MPESIQVKFDDKWVPVVHNFILRSPPCQLQDILQWCKHLTQANLPKELLGRACSDYNEKHMIAVRLIGMSEGQIGLVCEIGRQGSRAKPQVPYSDPRADLIFQVDQESQECISVKKKEISNDLAAEFTNIDLEEAQPYRESLQNALDRYVELHHPSRIGDGIAAGAVYSFMGEEIGGDIELRFYVSARRARAKGQWAGKWTSQWRVIFTPGETPAKLVGIVEFQAFYSEDANINFYRKLTKQAKVAETTDPEKFAKEVVVAMGAIEDEFHKSTEELCVNFHHTSLKTMRRVLPITKEKFDWRPIRHALVKDMKNSSKVEGA